MYIRRNSAFKYCAAILLGAALYSEVFVYMLQSWYWQDMSCLSNDPTCTKILFIADPQIQGENFAPWPLNSIFIWDSDRYIAKTFERVVARFKPDVLVYLGDLMDEGSVSTLEQFYAYVKRLADIFDISYPVVQVWLPGDNDIGGENEGIDWEKLSAFHTTFDQPSVVRFRNVSFYKVNAITWHLPAGEKTYLIDKDETSQYTFKIALSHYPLMIRTAIFRELENAIKPRIYFCAHDHESKYTVRSPGGLGHEPFRRTTPFYERRVLTVPFSGEDQYEIYVPTCSYRMGTSNIGYGVGILDNNNAQMRYTVFWTPKRFAYLFGYLFIASAVLLFALICCALKVCCVYYERNKKGNLPLYITAAHKAAAPLRQTARRRLGDMYFTATIRDVGFNQ